MTTGSQPGSAPLARSRSAWRHYAATVPGTMLFENTRAPEGAQECLLFRHPRELLTAHTGEDLAMLFDTVEQSLRKGCFVAGYCSYEAAYPLHGHTAPSPSTEPLAHFGVYSSVESMIASAEEQTPSPVALPPLCLEIADTPAAYSRKIAAVKQRIEAGDTYQVNLTTALTGAFSGSVEALYAELARNQPAAYTALLHPVADQHLLSHSPELFFQIEAGRRIKMRPMKGTAPLTDGDRQGDAQAAWLRNDEKNRAEHVMIVDLLRNDLGRICETGSVTVEDLFTIERYASLLQMTSTVAGQLSSHASLSAIFRSLFPSGSMTGAPKLRTMQIIRELEGRPRGVYSGAIGYLCPDGRATFSVAIRTVTLQRRRLHMGIGSGVVADSDAQSELAECWLKARFLLQATSPFQLFETLLWNSEYVFLSEHLTRLQCSAESLGFQYQREAAEAQLETLRNQLPVVARVKLLLDRDGTFRLETSAHETWPDRLRICVAENQTSSDDPFLRHKTTERRTYDQAFTEARRQGFDEVLFSNERGELTEGAISSLLWYQDGAWKTPFVRCGALPGVARSRLIATGQVTEALLLRQDLSRVEGLALCNSLRGIRRVTVLQLQEGTLSFPGPALPELPNAF